jgi:hypothetical protein
MSAENDPAQRVAIGISFGNSYSSIGFTTGVCPAPIALAGHFLTK